MHLLASLKRLFTSSRSINVPTAMDKLSAGAVLVDVRSTPEWRSGHAPQAVHIPMEKLENVRNRFPADTPIVTVCASGVRSLTAAKHLAANGYETYSIRGGMHAWARAGNPTR